MCFLQGPSLGEVGLKNKDFYRLVLGAFLMLVWPLQLKGWRLDLKTGQEIHFVTGKGGVGKSTFAAALAYQASLSGKKVLLIELGDESFYRHFFGVSQISFNPTEIKKNLYCVNWVGEQCLKDYIKHLVKSETFLNLFWENPVSKSLVKAAPGLSELSILGKITSGIRRHGPSLDFDVLVIDAYSTGHFRALLMAPEGLKEAIKSGPIHEQGESIKAVLMKGSQTHFHIVTLCEEFPLQEALELETFLVRYGIENIQFWLNKVLSMEGISLESDPSSEFLIYLKEINQRQEKVLEHLKNKKVSQLPWVLKNSPWEILEGLSGGQHV